MNTKYIYESPDRGQTIYRSVLGDFKQPKELIRGNGMARMPHSIPHIQSTLDIPLNKKNLDLRFNFLGFNNEQPKWNYDLYNEMKKCYFALNLSRGGPYKYTSSNRIATYIGNGMPTCVDEKIKFSETLLFSKLILL